MAESPSFGDGHRRTLREWVAASIDPRIAVQFEKRQRERWIARKVIARWRHRIWIRRVQCNVSLIEMTPVSDADALLITDTTQRQIFRFHRSDIYNTLLFNLALASHMLPTPRAPSNPWTNKPLTYGQTVHVCKSLLRDFGNRGVCPPPLFSLFWQAGFDLRNFERIAAPMLGYNAITAYFKEITIENRALVSSTMSILLARAGHYVADETVIQWIQQPSPEQQEWLALVRDYTIYINLHIQVRPEWLDRASIIWSVQELFQRTPSFQLLTPTFDPNDIMSYYVQFLLSSTEFTTIYTLEPPMPDLIEPDEMTGILSDSEPAAAESP